MVDGRFTCPVCGGHYFGTQIPEGSGVDLTAPMEKLEGFCKGALITPGYKQGYEGCSFVWSRADDEKYFVEEEEV